MYSSSYTTNLCCLQTINSLTTHFFKQTKTTEMWLLLGQSWRSDDIKLYCNDDHNVDGSYRDDTTLQHIQDLQQFPSSIILQNQLDTEHNKQINNNRFFCPSVKNVIPHSISQETWVTLTVNDDQCGLRDFGYKENVIVHKNYYFRWHTSSF